jgi:hypothetical protein
MTLAELKTETKELTEKYQEIANTFNQLYTEVKAERDKIPKFFGPKDDVETYLLIARHAKHVALDIYEKCSIIAKYALADEGSIRDSMLIDYAEAALKEKGFESTNESAKKSIVNTDKGLQALKKVACEIESISKTADKMLFALQGDENSLRQVLARRDRS